MSEQGSNEWRRERLGRVTASRFADVMAGPKSAAYLSYARQLRAERERLDRLLRGEEIPPEPDFYSAATAWGKRNEPLARAEYAFRNDVDVTIPTLIVHSFYEYVAASSDGMCSYYGPRVIGLEIKCPFNPANHADTLAHGMPADHRAQVQGQIWVCDLDAVDFISFDPRRQDAGRYYQQRHERDDRYIAVLERAVLDFWQFVISGKDAPVVSDSVPILF